MAQAARKRMTYAEYLLLEQETDRKHEFLDGEAWMMAGGSVAHASLVGSIYFELRLRLQGGPCRARNSEQKLIVEETGLATYPDAAIYCDGLRRHPDDPHALVDPTLVAEVLSPSTEGHDRGFKFDHYRRLPSLRTYLLVASTEVRIEVATLEGPDRWSTQVFRAGDTIPLPELGVELSVDAVYADALDQLDPFEPPGTPVTA